MDWLNSVIIKDGEEMIQCKDCQYGEREVYEDQIFYNCSFLHLVCLYQWDNCDFYKPLPKKYDLKSLTNTLEKKDDPPT